MGGSIVLEHRKVLVERFGEGVLKEAVAGLPTPVREEYDEVRPTSWIRISTVEEVFRVVSLRLGRDVAEVHTEVGRLAVERTLRTLWRVFLRFTTDDALISRSPVIFAKAYDRGQVASHIPLPGRGEVVLSGWPGVGDFPLRGLCNGVGTLLRCAGRENVQSSVAERRPDGALIVVTWDP